MVCLGNICRSPLAQGILEFKVAQNRLNWVIDSAGTSRWHLGENPDPRSVSTAKRNGIDISHQKARQIDQNDFRNFDLILAMDISNYKDILRIANQGDAVDKVKLVLNYSFPGENRTVPDPYFDGGFDHVFQLLDDACEKIISMNSQLL